MLHELYNLFKIAKALDINYDGVTIIESHQALHVSDVKLVGHVKVDRQLAIAINHILNENDIIISTPPQRTLLKIHS